MRRSPSALQKYQKRILFNKIQNFSHWRKAIYKDIALLELIETIIIIAKANDMISAVESIMICFFSFAAGRLPSLKDA